MVDNLITIQQILMQSGAADFTFEPLNELMFQCVEADRNLWYNAGTPIMRAHPEDIGVSRSRLEGDIADDT